jgi:23S rRNA (guanosine2251-2'-O)-methyltransferase
MIISGKHEIEEALKGNVDILKIVMPKHYHIPTALYTKIIEQKVPMLQIDRSVFIKKYPDQDSIIALCDDVPLVSLEEVAKAKEGVYSRLLIMEEIEDPQNAGAMLRSAACFGFQGAVITKRRSTLLSKGALSASSGSMLNNKIARVNNIGNTIQHLQKIGYWIVGMDIRGKESPRDINYNSNIAVIMGNEEKGLHKKTVEKCDHLVRIPIVDDMNSLNVSVAFGIVGYEIYLSDVSKK